MANAPGTADTAETVYISFSAKISPATAERLLAVCANHASKGAKTIYLMLSTPGGHVMHGITLYNSLRALPVKVITHNMGSVNSVGNVVFLAGEERFSCPNASFMFHGVGFDAPRQMRFEQKNLRERLDGIIADETKIGAIIAERTSLSPDEVSELFREAVTRDPDYAKANGICHGIKYANVPVGCTLEQLEFQR